MPCCDFSDFKDGLIHFFGREKIGSALIDWGTAKTHWKKYHCTGGESAKMLVQELKAEREPIVVANLTRKIKQRLEQVQDQDDDD
ncbi:MAG: hypothetical protein Q8M20_18035 [Rhodocyclaceae bacterium]|nr:hypothetical protein [Rhodocyclaceae bacterium]